MYSEGRQEYVPGRRTASAGRARPSSALNPGNGWTLDELPPGTSLTTGFRGSRPFSAMGVRGRPTGATPAWGPNSEEGDGPWMGSSSRPVHAQSLAKAKGREQLAEDVVALREQVAKLREYLNQQKAEKRRVEQELVRTKASLLKSEEFLNQKERLTSPNTPISQLYRSPDTTQLVGNLRQQVLEHRAAVTRLEAELRTQQKSMRATKVSEMQSELLAMTGEVQRLTGLCKVAVDRAEKAERRADAEADKARRLIQQHGDLDSEQSPQTGRGSLRRTLKAMYESHVVLMREAEHLKRLFNGMSMKEFLSQASRKNSTSGAPDVLNFLRNHMSKLTAELSGQPGSTEDAPASPPATQEVAPETTRSYEPPGPLAGPDLMQAIADNVRKLRSYNDKKWRSSPTLQHTSEQLSDIMKLYVDEVQRLQGRAPADTGSAVQNDIDLDAIHSATQKAQSSAKEAEAALKLAQADLVKSQKELNDMTQQADTQRLREAELRNQLAALMQDLKDARAKAAAPAADPPAGDAVVSRSAPVLPVAAAAPPSEGQAWQVVIHTGRTSGGSGAYDGPVYLTLNGCGYNTSGELLLVDRGHSFSTGQADTFTLTVPDSASLPAAEVITSVGMRVEATDVTWQVAKLLVTGPTVEGKPGTTWEFLLEDPLTAGDVNMLFPKVPKATPKVKYDVYVRTSDCRGAGTDGQVLLTVVGDKGAADAVLLTPTMVDPTTSDSSSLFTRGNYARLAVSAADVGDLSHVVLRLVAPSGEQLHSSWAVDDVRVIHPGTGMASTFYCYDWLTAAEPRATLTEAYTWKAYSTYTVKVKTSDLPGADFQGAAYLTLNGCWSSSAELLLAATSSATEHDFQRNRVDTFKVQADDVGSLNSIVLRVEPTLADNVTWHIEQVVVVNDDNGQECVFNTAAWLHGPTSLTIYRDMPSTTYKLAVISAADAASFSGSVFATLNGAYGSTTEVQLVNSNCTGGNENVITFAPGGLQEFEISEKDIGRIDSCSLRVAASAKLAAAAPWKLDRVQIKVGSDTQEKVFTSADAMQLSDTGGSLTLSRFLSKTDYKVKVFTHDSPDDAGFDGQVFLKITGLDGSTDEVLLQPAPGETAAPFGIGASHEFTVNANNVGELSHVEMRLNKTGSADWWRLNRFEITNTATSQVSTLRYSCWCNVWNSSYTLYPQELSTYKVIVHTSPAQVLDTVAPFNGKMFVKLCSYYSTDSDEYQATYEAASLAPGGTAVVASFKCPVSWISYVSLRVEGGASPVHVRMVEVVNESSSDLYSTTYPVHTWVGAGYDASTIAYSESQRACTLNLHTAKGKPGLPAGAKLLCAVVDSAAGTPREEVLLDVPSTGIPSGSVVPITFNTFSGTSPAEVRLRVVDASGTWALQRASLVVDGNNVQANFTNPGGTLSLPGSATLVQLPLQQYVVTLNTSDKQGGDTDGVVMIRFVGDQGETEDLRMTVPSDDLYLYWGNALDKGHVDKYTVQAADVGKLKQVVVSLAAMEGYDQPHSGWHLASVSTLQAATGVVSHFAHNQWVDVGSEVTLDVQSTEQVYVDYTVTLVMNNWNGWHEADTYVTLKTDGGDATHRILLSPASAVRKEVGCNYHMIYSVRAANVSFDTIDFEMESNQYPYYICLKRIQVASPSASALFQFGGEWMYNWNGATTRKAASHDVYYQATVRTKNFPDAGWDGQVYLTLNGDEGDAPEVEAYSYWSSGFQPDSNVYCYFYGPDIGLVNAVTVRLANPSSSKKWSLDYIELYNYSKSTTSTFELGDGKHLRNGDATRIEKRVLTAQYEITAVTSDTRGAGTDGCVYVLLDGEQGRTEEIKLAESVEDFSRGRTTTFKVSAPDVGEVRNLEVRVGSRADDGVVHSSWHAAKLEVLNMSSGLKCNFNANKWIDPSYGTEYLTQSGTEQVLQTYRVLVTTSSLPGASFDGKAYITLNGWYASSAETALVVGNRSTASFSAGSTQEFTIKAVDVGLYLSNVSLRMVPTDSDPRWHVEKVVVISENSTRPQMEFFHNNWLNQDVTQATLSQTSTPVRYSVVVATSADAAATWDGQVYLTLNSQWWCSSDEIELVNSETTLYTPGVAQEFEIAINNVGPLASIDVRLAGGSSGSSLKFDRIEITDKETGKKLDFLYTDTLTPASGKVNIKVDVKQVDYKIALVTDKGVGNALPFDGDVYVTMYGMEGSSEEVKLVLEGEAGGRPILKDDSSVVAVCKAADVGALRYIYLRLDMCGSCTEYNITALEVTNVGSGATVRLPCGSQLSTSWNTTYIYPQSVTTFKVRVTTGAGSDANFNGSVYLTFSNWYATAKEVLLSNEKGAEAFKPGAVEEFTVATNEVSYISNVTVRVQPAESGASGRWNLGMIEIWDSSCSTPYISGYLHNNWLGPDTPSATLSQSGSHTYSQCEVAMAADSGPFSGNLWIALIDEAGTASNEVLLMSEGARVLDPGSTAQLGAATLYFSGSSEYISVRVDNNTASSIAWKPNMFTLTTDWGSQYRFEPTDRVGAGLEQAGSIKMKRVPEVQYEIKVVSEDVPGNGTDGSIRMVINGSKGASQEVYLYGDHERGASETTTTYVADLGDITSITVNHKDDGAGVHSQWCVGSIQVTHQDSGVCTTFKTRYAATGLGTWVDRGSSATFEVESSKSVYVDYKITLYTSAASGSGFDGGVRFKMQDVYGNQSCATRLAKGDLEVGPFKTGGVDTFTYKALDISEFSHVMVDLDGSGSTSTWGLSRIVVERPDTGAAWQFSTSGTVYYWQSYPSVYPTPQVYYNVEAYTNTVANKAFDGAVYLTLVGEDGETSETKLDQQDMSPGTTTYSYLKVFSPGIIKALRIRTEGGSQPAWNAGSIKLTNSETGAVAVFEPKAPIKAGARPVELAKTIKEVEYEVTVYTMDVKGAGTDGDVHLKLSGPNGDTQEVKLYNGADDFKRGAQDVFTFKAPDVGDCPTLQLRLAAAQVDGAEAIHSGWALDRVEVLNKATGTKGTYPYNTWLTMPSACATLTQASSVQALNKYTVRVKTGSLQGAGFDGVVRMDLEGWYDTIKDVKLAADGEDTAHLKDGDETVFVVRGVDIGRVTRVAITIEPNEMDPAWMLEHITVVNDDGGGYESSFHYNGWLNVEKPTVDIYANNPFISYKVVLATTDQADAGFDGELYLKLTGMNGTTEEVQLVNSTGLLAPASEETFTIKAADVAVLSGASLRLVGNKRDKKWHMKSMKVWVAPEDGSEPSSEPWLFEHHGWVEEGADPVELSRYRAMKEFKITLTTTDQSDAAFEGDVFVTLKGEDGEAKEVQLQPVATSTADPAAAATPAPGSDAAAAAATGTTTGGAPASHSGKLAFTAGSTITLPMTAQDVGKVNYVLIRLAATGADGCSTSWHLETLSLTDVASGAVFMFPAKCNIYADSGVQWLYPQSQYQYSLKVYTSDSQPSDFTGDVVIKLTNWWGETKEEKLAAGRTSAGAFKPGSCEEFSFKVDDVGWANSLVIRAEASSAGDTKWHCSHFELVNTDYGTNAQVFHHHDVITTGAEPTSISPETMTNYKAVLYLSNSNPDAAISLEDLNLHALLSGADDKWPSWAEVKLDLVPEEDPSAYVPADVTAYQATFSAPAQYPNKQKLQIRAAAGSSGNAAKWVLHRAKVFDDYNWAWSYYAFGNSLSSGIKLKSDLLESKEYEVVVHTRDVRGNGHDGTVSIVLEGSQAAAPEFTLDASTAVGSTDNLFERGSCNVFLLNTIDLGKIKTCAVKLAGGSHSQWLLDRLEITERATGLCTTLTHEEWITPQEDGLMPATKLKVTKDATPTYQDWEIVVWTAALSDAAYDGEVSLQLHDADGRSTNMVVLGTGDAGANRFQVGSKDVFIIKAAPVGELHHVVVSLSDKGSSSSWRISRIQVTNKATGACSAFTNGELLYSYNGQVTIEEVPTQSYSLYVYTANGDDWNGKAYATLHGTEGSTKEVPLIRWGEFPTLYANDSRYFNVSAYTVGLLKEVTFRTEEGSNTSLVMSHVEVCNDNTNATSTFRWDKALPTSKVTLKKEVTNTKWQLQVYTSDSRGAGTDADVYLSIQGDDAEVTEFKLSNHADNFSRGRTDVFNFNGPLVGNNKKLNFRLAAPPGQSAPHSSWYLGHAFLVDLNSGQKTCFYSWSWATSAAPVVVSESCTYKALYPYNITVTTGTAKGAEFEGEVWIKLHGWWGSTQELLLARDGKETFDFKAGSTETFAIQADDIGSCTGLELVRIVPTGNDLENKWQLDSIQVEATESGYSSKFEHANWLHAPQLPLTIYRTGENLQYKVVLHTANTSPVESYGKELLVTLKGMLGECDENQLVNSSATPLAPGSKEEYELKDSDVGALTNITLAVKTSSDAEAAPAWLLDKVEIINMATGTSALFPCLSGAKPGAAAPVWEQQAGRWVLPLTRYLPETDWNITVDTTDLPDATFDGDVMITLTGSEGTTGELRLPADPSRAYNPGQSDTFVLKAADVGSLQNVTVTIQPQGSGKQWHLSDITVSKAAGGVPAKFAVKSYLNDYNPSVTLYHQGPCKYDVTLVTAKQATEVFKGKVLLTLVGQYGSSTDVELTPAAPAPPGASEAEQNAAAQACALSAGNEAAWVMSCADVGPLVSAKIKVVPEAGSPTKWQCHKVVLRSERDPSTPYVAFVKGDVQGDGTTLAIRRVLQYQAEVLLGGNAEDLKPVQLGLKLQGTEAGAAAEEVVVAAPREGWAIGMNTVEFEAEDCGSLGGLLVRVVDESGEAKAGLELSRVRLLDKAYGGEVAVFWRNASQPALAVNGAAQPFEVLPVVNYKVDVVTGSARGAGTDGEVSLLITGDKSQTQQLSLCNDYWNNFERGRTDSFDVSAIDVGTIKSIKLMLSSTANSGWQLDQVSIDSSSGQQRSFKHGKWLGATEGSWEVELA